MTAKNIFPFRLRLFPRFLLFLTLLSVIPVALIGRIIVDINNESLQEEVQRYHLLLARSLADKVNERLTSVLTQLKIGISAIEDPTVSWNERQKLLTSLLDASPHILIISAVTTKGAELIKTYNPQLALETGERPSLVSHDKFPLFEAFRKSGQEQADVSHSKNGTFAELYVPFDTPVGKNAVYVKVLLNDLCDMISRESIGLTGYAMFVGKNGELLSRSRQHQWGEDKIIKDPSIVKAALTGNLQAREFKDQTGIEWVGASAPVAKLGGAIVTQQTRDEAYLASIKGKKQALMFVLFVILGAVIASYLLTRSLVKPLLQINQVAQNVDLSKGEFPPPITVNSSDEIQELAQTFNDMLQKLRGYADLQVEKLIIEQKKTEAIIFSIQDGIIMTDYEGKIQLISHRAKDILQLNGNDPVLGEALWKFLPNADLKNAFMELLSHPEQKKSIEIRMPSQPQDQFYTLSSEEVCTPLKKERLGLVTVIHDITLEKELDSMKEEFLHSITHDLRNPLTAIRGFIRLFQSGQTGSLSDTQKKMLETMDKASLRLLTMVNDILDLARMEARRLSLHLEPCHVDDVASRVIDLFLPQTRNSNVTLKLKIPDGGLPPLDADPNLMERVLTNLVGNAVKFTPDDGTITIRIEDFHDHVRFAVIDTGEGIPPSYLTKVFDKFRQVEGHFKGGSGLGLTICKRIVEAHQGRIWVESEVGKGSSFIFTIPRNLAATIEEKAA